MRRFTTYRHLLAIFYRGALMNELEYRLNFWSLLMVQLFWLVWSAIGVRVPFLYVDTIAGWSYPELLVVLGMFHVMRAYMEMLLVPNLWQMTEYVRTGTLDYLLTKPIDSQFMVSLRHLALEGWASPLLGLGLLGYGLWQAGHAPSPLDLLFFLVLTVAAMVVLYSLNLAIQSLTFWVVDMEAGNGLINVVVETGRFPVTFYHGWLRVVLTFVLPVAFLTTFPAQALLGRAPGWLAPVAVAIALAALVGASAFWRFALRAYTSASS
jgi:ABC-2 type transport system permease protein